MQTREGRAAEWKFATSCHFYAINCLKIVPKTAELVNAVRRLSQISIYLKISNKTMFMSKITFVLSSFVFALTIWSPSNAEPPPGIVEYTYWTPPKDAFPWDKTTHPACSDENREEKPPFCKKESDWPDFHTTWKRVNRLISRNSTHLLTKAEKGLVNNSKRFPTGEYMFEAWNQAMKYFTARDDNGKRKEISDAWITDQKGHGFSIMTRALLQYSCRERWQ